MEVVGEALPTISGKLCTELVDSLLTIGGLRKVVRDGDEIVGEMIGEYLLILGQEIEEVVMV